MEDYDKIMEQNRKFREKLLSNDVNLESVYAAFDEIIMGKSNPSVINVKSVFISYSRSDSRFVDRLENDLKARGYTCWVDRSNLTGGQNWVRMIQGNIDSCQAFVLVLSPDSAVSSWVQRELLYALEMKKLVVPLILRRGFRKPLELIERQGIDISVEYLRGFTSLVEALRSNSS